MFVTPEGYYTVPQAAQMADVSPDTLRKWEALIDVLKPDRISGRRLYKQKDIELIQYIKRLIRDRGYSIAHINEVLRHSYKSNRNRNRALLKCDNPITAAKLLTEAQAYVDHPHAIMCLEVVGDYLRTLFPEVPPNNENQELTD